MADGLPTAEARNIVQIAHIFKSAAHAARLRVLLALASGESDAPGLNNALRDLDSSGITAQLQVLYDEGLAVRKRHGRHVLYALSRAGVGVVRCYHIIEEHLGLAETAPPDQFVSRPAGGAKPIDREPEQPPAASVQLIDAVTLLNHAANPVRLRLLLSLTEGSRDPEELLRELEVCAQQSVRQHLRVLERGTLVASHRSGRRHVYRLTLNGLSLVQVVRATSSGLAIRRGELVLRPEPILVGAEGALDPTSPDGLACLLRAFAHPTRLRVLNVLVAAGEVCASHLSEALRLSERAISLSLAYTRRTGLVLDRRARQRVLVRPAPSASNLCRSLIGCFGLRLAEADSFDADRQRLQELLTRASHLASKQQEPTGVSSDRSDGAGPIREPARTG